MAMAPMYSPVVIFGSQRLHCSGVPKSNRYGSTMSVWVANPAASETAGTRASSSIIATRKR